ncbi:MAG TPA: 2-dehydropantoate 2-reductase [Sporichthya sp.]|nr:2-dehydropantoate 2-reductase [Sporichthya sp.]
MRIAVIGAGGVGGYFGARLAAAGHDVGFLVRGAQLGALLANGLTIHSPRGDLHLAQVRASDDPAELGAHEVVLFTVKAYAIDGALPLLRPLMGNDGCVVSLQNGGVAPAERVAAAVGVERTIGGAAYISCHLRAPGVLEHHSPLAGMEIGELTGGLSARVEGFAKLARDADLDADVSADIRTVLWQKFAFICGLAGATATSRHPIGEVRATETGRRMLRGLVSEAAAVGRADGAALPPDYEEKALAMLDSIDGGMRSSLFEDLVNGRVMELDSLHGEVVRRADELGVEVPVTRTVLAILEPSARAAANACA